MSTLRYISQRATVRKIMWKFHFYHNQEHQEESSARLTTFLQLISVMSTNRPFLPDPFSMFTVQLCYRLKRNT